MRVCLTNPPWRENGASGIRAGCRIPNLVGRGEHTFIPFPFALAYAAARLETEGVTISVIDAVSEELDQETYLTRVSAVRPDLIVNEMGTRSHRVDLQTAAELSLRTGARIAVCGPHPTALPREILKNRFIDFVLLGEFDETLVDLVRALHEGRCLADIDGLAYRSTAGKVVIGQRRTLIADLDSLPYPHRRTLPLTSYRVAGFPAPVLYMYSSRGCPYRCTFCVWPQWFGSGSYRYRSPRAVVDEIEFAHRKFGPFSSVYFDDDTFNLGRSRMLGFADEFSRRSWHIPWGCNARPDRFDEETIRRLADAGMFNIRIGVESGDPDVLRRVNKNLDLNSVRRCIDLAHDAGVRVHVTFTIGLSGESWSSVKRTVSFAKSITPDSIAFTITTPFPGTAYYDEVVREGYLTTDDWDRFNVVSEAVLRTDKLSPDEIVAAKKYVMRKVYYSPGYLFRRLRYVTSGSELSALARKGSRLLLRVN